MFQPSHKSVMKPCTFMCVSLTHKNTQFGFSLWKKSEVFMSSTWLTDCCASDWAKSKKKKNCSRLEQMIVLEAWAWRKIRKLLLSRGRKWKPCTEVATHWASCPPTPCKQRPINSSNFGSNRRVCAKLLLNFSEALKSASDREDPHW